MAEKYDYNILLNMLHEHDYINKHNDDCPECQKIMDYGKGLYRQGGGFTKKGLTTEERNSRIKTLVAQGYSLYTISEVMGYSEGHISRLLRELDIEIKNSVESITKIFKIKDGSIIKEYKTIAEAARESGTSSPCISRAICGNQKSAGGFEWKRIEV